MCVCPSLHAVAKIAKNWRNRSFCQNYLIQVVKEVEGCPAKTAISPNRGHERRNKGASKLKQSGLTMAIFWCLSQI